MARVSLLLAGIALGLLAAEAALRWLGNPYNLVEPYPDPQLTYRLRAGLRASVGGIRHDYNSRGLRDRDYPDLPPEGVTRALIVGDSVSFAQSLPLEATWVKQLEAALNRSGSGRYELLNGGVAGYNACQEEAFLRDIGSLYHPRIVLWQFCLNDLEEAWDPLASSSRGFLPLPRGIKNGLRHHSYLWNFLRVRSYSLLERAGLINQLPGSWNPADGFRTVQEYALPGSPRLEAAWRCVQRAADSVKAGGGTMIVVTVPLRMQADPAGGASDIPQREIARRCAAAGIPHVDALPAFRREPPDTLFLSGDYVHLTDAGHRVLASAVQEGLVPLMHDLPHEVTRRP
jgi:lysophospholipase L1-like esterase